MKAVLIRPPRFGVLGDYSMGPSLPLGLAYIAGALEAAGHHVAVIDAIAIAPDNYNYFKPYGKFIEGHESLVTRGLNFSEIIEKIPRDVQIIGIHCMFSVSWLADRYFIELLRQHFPQVFLVAGGEHVSGDPYLSLETSQLNAIVKGEGEETIIELAHAVENNLPLQNVAGIVYKEGKDNQHFIATAPRTRKRKPEDLPRPAWHLFPVEAYNNYQLSWSATNQRSLPILATRGCPYTCTFCSSPQMWGTRYYMRPPDDVFDEMQQLKKRYNIQNFDFYDLTAILKRDWIIQFCKLLVHSEMNITWQIPAGTRTEIIDREVSKWLYLSGCKNLVYAPESGSQTMLDAIHKKVSLPRMLNSIRQAKAENLNVMMNMILGLPGETHADIFRTLWFYVKASAHGVNSIAQANFQPYVGSELFNLLVREGKIDPRKDRYYLDMAYVSVDSRVPIYNIHVSRFWYRIYFVLTYFTFYASNFFFRPWRMFKTLYNIATASYESRFEKHIRVYINAVVKRKHKILVDEA